MDRKTCLNCGKYLQISYDRPLDTELCFYLECIEEKSCKTFLKKLIPEGLTDSIIKESKKHRTPFSFSFFDKMKPHKDCPYFFEHICLTSKRND